MGIQYSNKNFKTILVKCAFKQYKSTFKQYLEEKGECPFIAPHPKFGAKEGHLIFWLLAEYCGQEPKHLKVTVVIDG